MGLFTIILTLISIGCYSQDDYQRLLSVRLKEIELLPLFENSFVVYNESEGYGSTFPLWTPDMDYYEDDMVLDQGKIYRSIIDSKGKNPAVSPIEWKLIPWTHPYFFLRDTARTEDLRVLLTDKHPYVRTYSFAALAHRNFKGLFQVILDNLGDTTKITQTTGDHGYDVCPADLMISYKFDDLTTAERNQLRKLIETKYKHLVNAKRLLEDK